jgi:cytoskeletal protein CcmA (bactofilin family)
MKTLQGRLRVVLASIAGALLLVGLGSVTAFAADNRQGQTVTIGPGEVVNDDLYVAANTIDVQGTINGSLIAVGGTITVSGLVTRDVNAAASMISIPGEVQGSARLAGSQVTVAGKIDGDLIVASSTLSLTGSGSVGRDVMAAAATATFSGPIARDVKVAGSDIVFGSTVGGNVTAYDTTLKIDSGASIAGYLDYTSNQNVNLADGAQIAGPTHRYYPSNGPTFGSLLLGWVQTLVGFFLLGLLIIFLAPRFNARAVDAYKTAPWSRLGVGLTVLIVVPFVGLMAFVAGLIVGGWWLSFFLFAAYLLAAAVGFTLVGEMIGRFLFERIGQAQTHAAIQLFAGLVILLVLTNIPLLGWLFGLAAVTYGTGVAVMAMPWSRPPAPAGAAPLAPSTGISRPAVIPG